MLHGAYRAYLSRPCTVAGRRQNLGLGDFLDDPCVSYLLPSPRTNCEVFQQPDSPMLDFDVHLRLEVGYELGEDGDGRVQKLSRIRV